MGWQMNRNVRIPGDSSAARELREDLFKPSRRKKKNPKKKTLKKKLIFFFFKSYLSRSSLVLSIISSYPHFSAAFGDVVVDHCQSNKQVANCNGWLGLVRQPNRRRHEHIYWVNKGDIVGEREGEREAKNKTRKNLSQKMHADRESCVKVM
jgi:hypothetical protein